MLKGISPILPPELLKILMEMGHGDELVIGDGNFPAAACAQRLVRCDGHGVPEVLDAILQLFPLDTPDNAPTRVMQTAAGMDEPPVWATFRQIITKHENIDATLQEVERFAFYERAKKAYAIVATGETAIYANIILKKGVIKE